MKPFRSISIVTLIFVLVLGLASACGSGSSEVSGDRIDAADSGDAESEDAEGGDGDDESAETDADSSGDESEEADGDEATELGEDDVPPADAEFEPGVPSEVLPETSEQLLGHTMTSDETDCMISASEDDPDLGGLVSNWSNPNLPPSEPGVVALTEAMQSCLAPDTLGLAVANGWGMIGPNVGDTGAQPTEAPTLESLEGLDKETVDCFAGEIGGSDGPAVFSALFSRLLGFDTAPETKAPAIGALTQCGPAQAIANSMATSVEQGSGFNSEVDRECALEAVEDRREAFWTAVLSGEGDGIEAAQQAVEACATDINEGLLDAPPDGWEPWSGDRALAEVAPAARDGIYDEAPEMTIDSDGEYTAVIATDGGEIRLKLFADKSPITVNNFVNLANDGFYDGLTFHRVIEGFMAQGGDPTGLGSGGPGYQFEDEFDNGLVFDRAGLLAMANSGPETNGSQFFITFEVTDFLDGAHTIFGEVVEGDEVYNGIERRDPQTATGRGQVIESITIIEGE